MKVIEVVIIEIIKPITRLDYDELLSKTDISLYKGISVNFNHIPDSKIGEVLDVWKDSDDPNLVIARMNVRDEVYKKYKDKFGGCSVEICYNEDKSVVIPTQVSILSKDTPPAIKETEKFTLEKYSEDGKKMLKTYYKWEENKYDNTLNKMYNMLKEIFSSVKQNTGLKIIDDDWNWDKERVVIEAYCTNKDGTFNWDKYRMFFAYYDENNPQNKSSYKFPHHTIRNGNMVLVKKALASCIAYINGARGVKIDNKVREEAYKHLVEHYKIDLNEEPPKLKYNNEGDCMTKEDYSETIKKYKEEIDALKSEYSKIIEILKNEIEEVKNNYSTKIETLESEIKELKNKYGLKESEDNTITKSKKSVKLTMW